MLPPLRLAPIFRPMVWGGSYLEPWLSGRESQQPIGEAWLLSDEGDAQSLVAEGPFRGKTLRQLLREHPRAFFSSSDPPSHFPLLLKFLDARENLSVQVHPNDEQAARLRPGHRGKTEAWVILFAEPGSRIFAGLKPGVDRQALRKALASNSILETLHSFEPNSGDCMFLPAGTVHAIGAGVRLFEVQQSSDITFRLHDWGRADPKTGRPRDLHIDEGLECVDFSAGPVQPISQSNDAELLVDCRYFRLRRRRGRGKFELDATKSCRVVVALHDDPRQQGAAGMIRCEQSGSFSLRDGEVWLLPISNEPYVCEPRDGVTILDCEAS